MENLGIGQALLLLLLFILTPVFNFLLQRFKETSSSSSSTGEACGADVLSGANNPAAGNTSCGRRPSASIAGAYRDPAC